MIVVAIIGILAAIAIPAYQNYTVRSKVTELLNAASSAKTAVSEGFQSNGITGIAAASKALADENTAGTIASKYVSAVTIDDKNGMITVTSATDADKSGLPKDALSKTLTFTPSVAGAVLANTTAGGTIDWACSSEVHANADAKKLPVATAGNMPAKFVPAECK